MTEKRLNEEQLEKVDGGMAETFAILREEVSAMVPVDVQEKIKNASGDVEIYRILAENGINTEELAHKFKAKGINLDKIYMKSLPDEKLEKIVGGAGEGPRLICKCGATRKDWSFQILESFFASLDYEAYKAYRCEKCNRYIWVYDNEIVFSD